jgi:ATP adenylyltransferase
VSLDHLWNGWRAEYINGAHASTSSSSVSLFTQILQSGLPDDETFIVHRTDLSFVILNAYPYASGHLLVLPLREVAHLEDLTTDESADLWRTVTEATLAIKASHSPDAMNVGINLGAAAGGSVSQHLHVHVVPRWNGDSNFMTSIANTRTLPESLSLTATKVRAAWPQRTS